MKIFQILTHGGKWLLLLILLQVLILSCDPYLFASFDKPVKLNGAGNADVWGILDTNRKNVLRIRLNGIGYEVNPDSLKIVAESNQYQIESHVYMVNEPRYPYSTWNKPIENAISQSISVDNDSIFVVFLAHRPNKNKRDKKFERMPVYHLLPGNFITFDGKPVITDSINIEWPKHPFRLSLIY